MFGDDSVKVSDGQITAFDRILEAVEIRRAELPECVQILQPGKRGVSGTLCARHNHENLEHVCHARKRTSLPMVSRKYVLDHYARG